MENRLFAVERTRMEIIFRRAMPEGGVTMEFERQFYVDAHAIGLKTVMDWMPTPSLMWQFGAVAGTQEWPERHWEARPYGWKPAYIWVRYYCEVDARLDPPNGWRRGNNGKLGYLDI